MREDALAAMGCSALSRLPLADDVRRSFLRRSGQNLEHMVDGKWMLGRTEEFPHCVVEVECSAIRVETAHLIDSWQGCSFLAVQ